MKNDDITTATKIVSVSILLADANALARACGAALADQYWNQGAELAQKTMDILARMQNADQDTINDCVKEIEQIMPLAVNLYNECANTYNAIVLAQRAKTQKNIPRA